MKILVTGAGGQLGTDVIERGNRSGDQMIGLNRDALDIASAEQVRQAMDEHTPEVVVNCAAWTAVDLCESDPDRANLINGVAVEHLAQASAVHGAHLVQVSTDYVFDGTKTEPYVELDTPNPQSAYGRSKLIGEQAAAAVGASIVRTSWVCSAHGGNMVATIMRLAREHPVLSFVSDQRGHPTFTADLADALLAVGRDRVRATLHVTNAGPVSWFEFAQAVLHASGQDPTRVKPVLTHELQPQRPAPRPANSVLSNQTFHDLGYAPLRDFRAALADVVNAYEHVEKRR